MGLEKRSLLGLLLICCLFSSSFLVSAASVETTDVFGDPQIDFSPGELVYFGGSGFAPQSLISITVTRPDLSTETFYAFSGVFGSFFVPYDFGGFIGSYQAVITDGFDVVTVYFTDAAIWTTDGSCGDSSQDVNHYSIGDHVHINGDGFAEDNYTWTIKGKPGGASCDPNLIVASGSFPVNASGEFCFDAYEVMNDDCGEYQVKFDVKGDNYRVVGGSCDADNDCGLPSSSLVCEFGDVYNLTETPVCSSDSCEVTNESLFVEDCGIVDSLLTCFGDTLTNVTTIPSCALGACLNDTIVTPLEDCEYGCFAGSCLQCPQDGDNDGVCDDKDQCLGTKPNVVVDENGCSHIQFCKSGPVCGPGCELADWTGNNYYTTNIPNQGKDCTVALMHVEGKLYPTCTAIEYICQAN